MSLTMMESGQGDGKSLKIHISEKRWRTGVMKME